jgi:hypothetical protein
VWIVVVQNVDKMYIEEIPDHGHVMTVDEFLDSVVFGELLDCDGFGHPSRNGRMTRTIIIQPSFTTDIPKDATHIIWFNK